MCKTCDEFIQLSVTGILYANDILNKNEILHVVHYYMS